MEALRAELASLVRVRNRLAHSPDAAMPKILVGLLPRLADHLDRHTTELEILRGRRRMMEEEDAEVVDEELALRAKLQEHVSGIFMHALERVRGGHHTIPPGAPWIPPLLQKLQEKQQSSEPWTDVTVAFVLSLLQASLPYMKLVDASGGKDENEKKARAEQQRQYLSMLSSLGILVNRLRSSLLEGASLNRRNSAKELNYRSAAWMCLDLLALSWGLPLLVDWDRDHFDEYDWKTPTPFSLFGRESNISIPWLEATGLFHLALDLLLFWPPTPEAERLHRILHEAEHAVADHDSGISLAVWDLLNSRRDRSRQRAWNVRFLRELKYSCANQIVEVLRTEHHASTAIQGDRTATQRALLLCVLAGSSGSMHGKLALQCLNRSHHFWKCQHGSRGSPKASSVLAGCKEEGKRKKKPLQRVNSGDASPQCPYDLTFASCLLVLILGERVSRPILEKHADERAKIEALLGPMAQQMAMERGDVDAREQDQLPAQAEDPMDVDQLNDLAMDRERAPPVAGQLNLPRNHNQTQTRFRRAPMPFGVAERAIDFITSQLLPKDLPEGFVDLTNTGGGHINLTAMDESDRRSLGLFVELALALKDQKGRVGSYWAIQIIHQLPSPESFDGESFTQTSLDIATAVLSHIAQAEVEGQQLLGEMEQRQDQGPRALGVPGPFGDRRDLNTLLADHRVSQRKRQLRADCALQARETAYGIVTELAPQVAMNLFQQLNQSTDRAARKVLAGKLFEMPITLLRCAVGEVDVGMHVSLTKAMASLLKVFQRCIESDRQALSEAEIAPLLPSLLCAVCADSSAARLGATKWAVDFIAQIDPPVSRHICSHIADDGDPMVAAAARKGLLPVDDVVMQDAFALDEVPAELSIAEDKAMIALDLDRRVQELALTVDLPPYAARIVLGHCGFDTTKASEMNSNRNKMLEDCGIVLRCGHNASFNDREANGERLCEICYDDVNASDMFSMPCGHEYCYSCWQGYLGSNLQAWASGPPSIVCPEQNCAERVAKEDVAIVAPELVSQWNDIELRSFVDGDSCYSRCPGPDCTTIVRSDQSRGTDPTRCSKCSSTFCFLCGSAPHQPAHCADFAKWQMIYADSDIWIKKHSKPCPGCDVPIEKNEGCNHIHCSRCNFDFCWLCLGPLGNDHFEPHICNRYQPEAGANDERERRALFYSGRYEAHDSAALFANDHAKSFADKRDKMAAETLWFLSDDDFDLSERALDTLVQARNFLKHSYVAAWAMSDESDARDRFEGYQANLELFTEQLSWWLLMTQLHNVHTEGGSHAIRMHFRAVSFGTASIDKYMGRILALLEGERERQN